MSKPVTHGYEFEKAKREFYKQILDDYRKTGSSPYPKEVIRGLEREEELMRRGKTGFPGERSHTKIRSPGGGRRGTRTGPGGQKYRVTRGGTAQVGHPRGGSVVMGGGHDPSKMRLETPLDNVLDGQRQKAMSKDPSWLKNKMKEIRIKYEAAAKVWMKKAEEYYKQLKKAKGH